MSRIATARHTLLFLAVAGAGLVAALAARHGNWFGGDDAPTRWEVSADVTLTDFELEEAGPHGTSVHLTANRATMVESNRRILVERMDLVYRPEGAAPMHINAATGVVDLDTRRVTMRGGEDTPLRVALAGGTTLTTRVLHWDPKAGTVTSEDAATVTDHHFSATGSQVAARTDEQSVRLSGGVTAQWRP